VIDEANVPPGMTVDDQLRGHDALVQPVALLEDPALLRQPGFVDARMSRVGTSGPGSYWDEGGFVTWAALYDTPIAAGAAFAALVSDHQSPDGWNMQGRGDSPFGDEGVSLAGPAYGFDAQVHAWRTGNLLLAAVALGVTVTGEIGAADELWSIAHGMDSRVVDGSRPTVILSAILVPPDAPPPGVAHDYSVGESADVRLRPMVSSRGAEFLGVDGFSYGRYEAFSGDAGLLMSLAMVFDSVEHAEAAYDLYLDELLSDEGYAATGAVAPGFGDDGTCAEFDNPSMGGIHEHACLWRNLRLVLIAGGTLPPAEIRAIAEGMNARASDQLR
jgi:hypothetical protein